MEEIKEKLEDLESEIEHVKAQNRKILNVITKKDSLEREEKYEELHRMARKTHRGVTRKKAAEVLDINHRNVGPHFERLAEKHDELVVAEGRGQKPERLVHTKYTIIDPDSSGSKSGMSEAAKSWLGGA